MRALVILAALLGAALIASAQPARPTAAGAGGAGSATGGAGPVGSGSATDDGGDDDEDDDDDDDDLDDPDAIDVALPAAGLAALDQKRTIPVGFDHLVHDRNLVVGNHDSIPCAQCHRTSGKGELVGRPDHRACFGACHGAAPVRLGRSVIVDERAKVCAACHAPAELVRTSKGKATGKLAVAYPPYQIDRDHGMRMSHPRHAVAACTACHATPAAPSVRSTSPRRAPATPKRATRAAHARCTGCHAQTAKPAMTECAECHVAAFGTAAGPTQVTPAIAVAFDHAGHARHAPRAECAGCHAAINTTEGIELPTPKGADCATAGCHDGTAFAVTRACTTCHRERPADWDVHRPSERFSHDRHAERIGDADCASCHRLGRSGDAATTGHAACDDAKCHATDFLARKPRTCGACHVGTEPWRNLTEDQRPVGETEFGARLPHARHTQPCTSCHGHASGGRELRPPRGHAACTGAACHAAAGGAAPQLAACDACHQAGLVDARHQIRIDARWSVRARFRHAAHAIDSRDDTLLACEACHDAVSTSTALADVPAPRKATCAPCHDGATAFKLTGTACARCHGTGIKPVE